MLRSIVRSVQGTPRSKNVAGAVVVAVAVVVVMCWVPQGGAQVGGIWGGEIDAEALQILRGMTDYMAGLQEFSMHTENTFEDVLETGQKIQFGFSSSIVVQRPDKLRAVRSDGRASDLFVYDGATLSMHHGEDDFFATVAVPENLDDFLHFARDSLDLVPPAGDMVFSNAFELLTASVTSGFVVGKAVIGGASCDHLAFKTPVVDWQVWVADGDQPLPVKYVLTTRDDPAQPQFVTHISDWNTEPEIEAMMFEFEAPETAMEIDVIIVDVDAASAR